MDERRFSKWTTIAAAALVGYLVAYGALRASHVLVRTGLFTGSASSRVFSTEGRWVYCDVVGRRDAAGRYRWAEIAFWPVILVERTFWNTVGCHLKPPYRP